MLKPIYFSNISDVQNLIRSLQAINLDTAKWSNYLLVLPNYQTYLSDNSDHSKLDIIKEALSSDYTDHVAYFQYSLHNQLITNKISIEESLILQILQNPQRNDLFFALLKMKKFIIIRS